MSHIFWNKSEIPIPENAHVNRHDGRVYFYVMNTAAKRNSKRKVIGHAVSETTMHPNEAFKYIYPNLWEQYYGTDSLSKKQLNTGMFAASLGAGYLSELYPVLIDVYGPKSANLLMDYANYSILYKSNVSMSFPEKMTSAMTFSKKVYSDSYLSTFFAGNDAEANMDEDHRWLFRDKWIDACRRHGLKDVWISIDGSNNDCDTEDAPLAEKGNAKSHTNSNIISYMYAVNAETGCPVSFLVYEGGKVDSKAFQKLAVYLHDRGINIKGVILDRGFCTYDVFHLLNDMDTDYVIMLKANTYGYTSMLKEYGEKIRWNAGYLSGMDGIFGITAQRQLFAGHEEKAYISLFFDGANGSARVITLLNKILSEKKYVEKQISEGVTPVISPSMKKYLSLEEKNSGWNVICNITDLQEDMNSKGFSAIASSKDFPAEEVNRLYNLRDVSEKQYMITKTQLGCSVTRVHHQNGIENKFLVTFIAACLRSEFQNACKKAGLNTSRMIDEMGRTNMMLLESGTYVAIHDETERQKKLLYALKLDTSIFDVIVGELNKRSTGEIVGQIFPNPYPQQPEKTAKEKETQSEVSSGKEEIPSAPKKKGRPPGSRNKKTLEREAMEAQNPSAPKKIGRPAGSKNKKTLEREAKEAEARANQPKLPGAGKGPGRPKGSKNRPKSTEPKVPRKKGRPTGSKDSYQRTRKNKSETKKIDG